MKVLFSIVAISAAIALFSCGGGGTHLTITTSSMDKTVFAKRAGAICERDNEPVLGEFGQYQQKHPNVSFGEAIKWIFPPIAHREVEEIRALGAPAGDEQQVEDFLVAVEEDAQNLAADPPVKESNGFNTRFHHSSQLAAAYGIEGCNYG